MTHKKPSPIANWPAPKVCPICGKSSYSAGGIHPQCAVVQADAPRRAVLAAEKKASDLRKAAEA